MSSTVIPHATAFFAVAGADPRAFCLNRGVLGEGGHLPRHRAPVVCRHPLPPQRPDTPSCWRTTAVTYGTISKTPISRLGIIDAYYGILILPSRLAGCYYTEKSGRVARSSPTGNPRPSPRAGRGPTYGNSLSAGYGGPPEPRYLSIPRSRATSRSINYSSGAWTLPTATGKDGKKRLPSRLPAKTGGNGHPARPTRSLGQAITDQVMQARRTVR
jgi:hypothetical protein